MPASNPDPKPNAYEKHRVQFNLPEIEDPVRPVPTEAERRESSKNLGVALIRDSAGGDALTRLARREATFTNKVTRCFQILQAVRMMMTTRNIHRNLYLRGLNLR